MYHFSSNILVVDKDSGFVLFGEKGTEGQPHYALQLPEEGTWRGRC